MVMHEYTLCPAQGGFELRGGRLEEPLIFRDRDSDIPGSNGRTLNLLHWRTAAQIWRGRASRHRAAVS